MPKYPHFSFPALAGCDLCKSLGEDTFFRQAKKPADVLICICIVYFIDISGFGTNVIHLAHRFFLQYVVNLSKIMTSTDEVMQISVKP